MGTVLYFSDLHGPSRPPPLTSLGPIDPRLRTYALEWTHFLNGPQQLYLRNSGSFLHCRNNKNNIFSELLKFCREIHKRFPDKRCDIKYDRLFVDNDVYVWNEKIGRIERVGSGSSTGSAGSGLDSKKSPSKYSKTFLEVDEEDIQSRLDFPLGVVYKWRHAI